MPTSTSLPPRRGRLLSFIAVLAVSLAACGTAPASPDLPDPVAAPVPTAAAPAPVTTAPPATPAPDALQPTASPVLTARIVPPLVLSAETPPVPDVITALLSYADRLHALSPADLAAEIVVQGDPGTVPLRQLQLALALIHLRQPAETARALGLVQRVIAHTGPESLPLKPLARLLANRLMDQRRLEDSVERQAQQLRDSQRRIDQLNERLEAMRAIERSLTTRPPAAAPNGSRPAP